jgi:transcription initiation factor TFIIIB Brf1 subunit/transcription initiation factor TFIIB
MGVVCADCGATAAPAVEVAPVRARRRSTTRPPIALLREAALRLELSDSIIATGEDLLVRGRKVFASSRTPKKIQVLVSLYLASRMHHDARHLREILPVLGPAHNKQARVKNMVRTVKRELKLKVPIVQSEELVARFAFDLGLPPHAVIVARRLLEQDKADGGSPFVRVATVLYAVSRAVGVYRSQDEVAAVCHVTSPSIRGRLKVYFPEHLKGGSG